MGGQAMTEPPIVGLKNIADRLGKEHNTVLAWRKRGILPPPAGYVSGAPFWTWQTIRDWARATGRLS